MKKLLIFLSSFFFMNTINISNYQKEKHLFKILNDYREDFKSTFIISKFKQRTLTVFKYFCLLLLIITIIISCTSTPGQTVNNFVKNASFIIAPQILIATTMAIENHFENKTDRKIDNFYHLLDINEKIGIEKVEELTEKANNQGNQTKKASKYRKTKQ